jgi:hypothetical protein
LGLLKFITYESIFKASLKSLVGLGIIYHDCKFAKLGKGNKCPVLENKNLKFGLNTGKFQSNLAL